MDNTVILGIMFTGLLTLLAGLFAWYAGLFQQVGTRPFPQLTLLYVVAAFGFYVGVQLLITPSLIVAVYSIAGTPIPLDDLSQVKYSIIAMAMGGLALLLFCMRKILPYFRGFSNDFLLGSSVWFLATPAAFFLGQITEWFLEKGWGITYEHQIAIRQLKQSTQDPLIFGMMLGVVLLLAPLLEEVLFRGVLYSYLRQRFTVGASLFLSSIVFASFHFNLSQGWSNVQLLITLFVLSCFMGWLFERQRALGAPIGLHFLFNLSGVYFIFNGN